MPTMWQIPATLHPERIVVLKPCCLGDLLMTTPLLAALRYRFPDASITYAVGAWSRPVVETSEHVDDVLVIPDRWTLGSMRAVAEELRRRNFDAAFVPERTPLSGIVTLLAQIPVRVGLDSGGRGFSYTHPVQIPGAPVHEADLYLALASAIGVPSRERRLWFFPSDKDRQAAMALIDHIPGDGPLVVLHPGGGNNPGMLLERKRWLPQRWAVIADRLHREYGARIVIVGSGNETDVAEAVRSMMVAPAVVLARQWRWSVLAAFIEQAALFLGHDTGMSMVANAVNTPHIVVFGPSDPQMYGPYGPAGRYVWHPTPQSPCFYDGSAPADCPCAGQCMRNVEVHDVWKAIEALWHERHVVEKL